MVTLKILGASGNGSSFIAVGDMFGIGEGTVRSYYYRTINALIE
jgi:hypothetical protein